MSVFSKYINCRNHKLALCMKHLIKRYDVLREVDSMLVSLALLFENSAQRSDILKNIQTVQGLAVLMPVKPSVTRWLTHKSCCDRVFARFECFLDALDQIYNKKRTRSVRH